VIKSSVPLALRRRARCFRQLAFVALLAGLSVGAADAPPAARADEVVLGAQHLRIDAGNGFCALDRNDSTEQAVLRFFEDMYRGKSQLLAFWGDCASLARFRNGTSDDISPYVTVLGLLQGGRATSTNLRRPEFIRQMVDALARNEHLQDALTESVPEMQQRFDDALGNLATDPQFHLKIGEVKSVGLLRQDEHALYFGILAHTDMNGQDSIIAGVVGTTQLKGLAVATNVYADYADPRTFDALSAQAQAITDRLITDNNDLVETVPISWSSGLSDRIANGVGHGVAYLILGAIAAGIAGLWRAARRRFTRQSQKARCDPGSMSGASSVGRPYANLEISAAPRTKNTVTTA